LSEGKGKRGGIKPVPFFCLVVDSRGVCGILWAVEKRKESVVNTRLDAIRRDYETYEGTDIVRTPGKYEGECTYVPYLWESGNGDAGEEYVGGTTFSCFTIGPDEANAWPNDLSEGDIVVLFERSDGFVCELSGGVAILAEIRRNEAEREKEDQEPLDEAGDCRECGRHALGVPWDERHEVGCKWVERTQ